jgi:hypothetical protein
MMLKNQLEWSSVMKKLIIALGFVIICFGCKSEITSLPNNKSGSQTVLFESEDLDDCNEVIFNPDMGFYSTIKIPVTESGISNKSEIISEIKEKSVPLKGAYPKEEKDLWGISYNLIHLEFDISAYSKAVNGKEDIFSLSTKALNDVRGILSAFRGCGKTAIVRFAYDPDIKGNKNKEPATFNVILNHVKQIAEVYSEYADVLTAIECGMIGPWGEMHSSVYAVSVVEEGRWHPDYYLVQVMHEYLEGLKSVQIPFLVRQPKFIYAYLFTYYDIPYDFKLDSKNESYPKTIPSYTPKVGTDMYKLGLYNDGYLGSESDSGTYKGPVRSDEIAFLSEFTNHTPYGGELIGNYGIENGGTVSVENFANVHVSFLNIGWNRKFFYGFNSLNYADESLFQYLYKHLGYRYLLKEVSITEESSRAEVRMNFSFENSGFANLPYHRAKKLFLYFIPTGIDVTGNEKEVSSSSELFKGQETLNVTADVSALKDGTYDVYVKLADTNGDYVLRPFQN